MSMQGGEALYGPMAGEGDGEGVDGVCMLERGLVASERPVGPARWLAKEARRVAWGPCMSDGKDRSILGLPKCR